MTERWLVVGTDERLKHVAKQLSHESRTVYYKSVDKWDTNVNKCTLEYDPTHIVLPIQPLQLDGEVAGILQAQLFVGKLSPPWHDALAKKDVQHYLHDETFIWKNAALTAESFLAHLYEEKVSVQHKRVLIAGFGRVGKMLALFLSRLQAHVIIAVRSTAQQAEAIAYGYEGIELNEQLPQVDFLINTIPTAWLTSDYQPSLTYPIYDIASAPGCLREFTLSQYELLPALPGKYFPKAAANVLLETILRLRKERVHA